MVCLSIPRCWVINLGPLQAARSLNLISAPGTYVADCMHVVCLAGECEGPVHAYGVHDGPKVVCFQHTLPPDSQVGPLELMTGTHTHMHSLCLCTVLV